MAKKKNNQTVVNNIESVNLDIDTKKLAQAIVDAQQKANEQYSVSREMMKFVIFPVLCILAFVSGVISIAFWGILFTSAKELWNAENWLIGVVTFLIIVFIALFTLILTFFLALTAKEIDKENDRNYISSMFSNVVAIVALIVALIALVKEVG